MIVSSIFAVSRNGVIGKDNRIPWYLPADLKYFKKRTLGHHVIMGRKTFESIGKALPKRTNIVITRNPFYVATNCIIVNSVEEALSIAQDNGDEEAFIIGGSQIFEKALAYIDRLYLTEVDLEVDGDVFLPELDKTQWEVVFSETHQADEKNEHGYTYYTHERKADTATD